LLLRQVKSVLFDEELRFYLITVAVSIALITWNVFRLYDSLGETLRHVFFQVSSIITTTGFSTTDFDMWPSFSKAILLFLMMVGACAGSTGGGLKCTRVLLLFKSLGRNIKQILNPNKVLVVRNNKRTVDETVLDNLGAYLAAYVIIGVLSFLVISLDGFSVETNLSAMLACFNNIGPGFDAVGPMSNFSGYSVLSKLVLSFDMLAGRLEIFPMLVIFSSATWKRHR